MTWAFAQDVEPPAKLVLLALANRANHETGLCHPGQALIGRECSMSDRTVRRHLKTLEQRGLIVRRARMLPEGRGRTSDEYLLACYQPDNLTGRSGPTGQIVTTNRTNQDDQPDTVVRVTVREPKENRKRLVPDDWQPSPALADELSAAYPTLNIRLETVKFRDWHGAKGNKFANHDKAFRNWMRKAAEYAGPKQTGSTGNGGVFYR